MSERADMRRELYDPGTPAVLADSVDNPGRRIVTVRAAVAFAGLPAVLGWPDVAATFRPLADGSGWAVLAATLSADTPDGAGDWWASLRASALLAASWCAEAGSELGAATCVLPFLTVPVVITGRYDAVEDAAREAAGGDPSESVRRMAGSVGGVILASRPTVVPGGGWHEPAEAWPGWAARDHRLQSAPGFGWIRGGA